MLMIATTMIRNVLGMSKHLRVDQSSHDLSRPRAILTTVHIPAAMPKDLKDDQGQALRMPAIDPDHAE